MRVFYAPPFVDMHNRMKEALVLLGRLPAAHVRPPLTPVSDAERAAIRIALQAAGLMGQAAVRGRSHQGADRPSAELRGPARPSCNR